MLIRLFRIALAARFVLYYIVLTLCPCTFFSHEQIQDVKDLHHLSLVGSYGAHLLHGFPPHFLHPTVASANTTGSPFGSGGAFVKPFPSNLPLPSAFAPPTKCVSGIGLEQVSELLKKNEIIEKGKTRKTIDVSGSLDYAAHDALNN